MSQCIGATEMYIYTNLKAAFVSCRTRNDQSFGLVENQWATDRLQTGPR
jgi:hypothetical protein